jgi:hypothetical protein
MVSAEKHQWFIPSYLGNFDIKNIRKIAHGITSPK